MKKTTLILIVLNLSIWSYCQNNGFSQEDFKKIYIKIDSLYPNNLTNNFPKITNGLIIDIDLTYPGATKLNKACFVIHFDSLHFKIMENEIKSKAIKQYYFTDTCLRIIDYASYVYRNAPFVLKKCCKKSKLLPIPNFRDLAESPLPQEIFKTATIYVLGAKEGKFLPDDKLYKNKKTIDYWKHGYSQGAVVLKNNLIFFWLEIW